MTADTTLPSYWLNWRFLLCAIWIFVAIVFSALVIWRYEGRNKSRNRQSVDEREAEVCLYEDEVWGTCSKSVHPIWLLAYRIVAFSVLLALLLADIITNGVGKFYFYTEWTFTLVTIYFGLGSSVSIQGCLRYYHQVKPEQDCYNRTDAEGGSYIPPTLGEDSDMVSHTVSLNHQSETNHRTAASVQGYALQIVFQMCSGAVVLTDSIFWLMIYPFLTAKDYRINYLIVCKHSLNAVLLLGDASLNSLRFPFFRMAYFVLWTGIFVIFQWIIHACVSIRWPYPFLDLSSPYAPLWYLAIGILLFPCFGIFSLIFWMKRRFLSR
ncbi:hypothetical protein ABFS82_12G118800 [Erythranthe guttata]|uniref:uncharacterized protein LOC105968097 n=1 Tax=Erythranthe guttata TaxID=4155 RepID=UPI00064DBD84|nr:PREDICTED: uncharacterized protein LOC105968097 [Erythranthe guttata]|eukprot:XP_012848167.1 PREDICTED: uncharacterized protein LOC105968097 [Erythranthe guttata]